MSATSETVHFNDRGPAVFAVTTTTLVIAAVLVIGRVISRACIVRNFSWDDFFIVCSILIAFGLSFAIDYGVTKGLGRGDADIKPEWVQPLRKCEYVFSVLYNPALMATKTSILIFYLRLSKNTKPILRIGSYVTLGIVNIAGVILTFLNIFQCSPVGSVFSAVSNQDAKCIPLVTLYLVSAPVNIITDLAILVLPLPVLTSMRLPSKQKNILVGTFLLGVFVTVVDVIRIYYLQEASFQQESKLIPTSSNRLGDASNFAWTASLSLMWSAVEVNVGIICATIPTLKPLVGRLLPKWIDHATSSLTRSGTHNTKEDIDIGMGNHPPVRLNSDASPRPNDIQSLPPAHTHASQEEEMGFMDFLTTPGMEPPLSTINRTRTAQTSATDNETVYFGFVNMRRPKSMMKTRGRESWKYGIAVTILFFLWGFSYGLLNTLNSQIGIIIGTNEPQTIGLQSAYFGAYFFGPLLVGRTVLKKGGFKTTFITGLCIYGIGIICFWPAAVLASYAGFVVATFMTGFGLSVLETAANPFLALCGAPRYMEMRLLLAQGVQATASVISPLLASKALFTTIEGRESLIDVQWTYLAIALFCVILALFFYYMPLPEATDEDLHMQTLQETPFSFTPQNSISSHPTHTKRYLGKIRIVYITLGLAVASQYLYVAAQESISQYFGELLDYNSNSNIADSPTSLNDLNNLLVAHATFAIGRFAAAGLCHFFKPRLVLLGFFIGTVLFSVLVFACSSVSGNALAALSFLLFFMEAPLFPLIFAIALRGMGRRTKDAAAFLVSAVSGGAAFPWVMYAIRTADARGVQFSYCVVVALTAVAMIFPVYLCLYPAARSQVDPRKLDSWITGDHHVHDEKNAGGGDETPIRRFSNRISIIFAKIKPGSTGGGSDNSDGPVIEHDENISPAPGTSWLADGESVGRSDWVNK